MNPLIEQFVSQKRIAVVGMSRSGKKFGNMAAKELKAKGYEIYPVHPEAAEIDGFACSPSLSGLNGKIDAVWISVPPAKVSPVLNEAAEIGLKNIWLQQGAWSAEVESLRDSADGVNQAPTKKLDRNLSSPVSRPSEPISL